MVSVLTAHWNGFVEKEIEIAGGGRAPTEDTCHNVSTWTSSVHEGIISRWFFHTHLSFKSVMLLIKIPWQSSPAGGDSPSWCWKLRVKFHRSWWCSVLQDSELYNTVGTFWTLRLCWIRLLTLSAQRWVQKKNVLCKHCSACCECAGQSRTSESFNWSVSYFQVRRLVCNPSQHKLLVLAGQYVEDSGEIVLQRGSFSLSHFLHIFNDEEVSNLTV